MQLTDDPRCTHCAPDACAHCGRRIERDAFEVRYHVSGARNGLLLQPQTPHYVHPMCVTGFVDYIAERLKPSR